MIGARTDSDRLQRAVVETPLGRFGIAASEKGLRTLVPLGVRADSGRAGPPPAPGVESAPASAAEVAAQAPGHAHVAAAAQALRAYCAREAAPYAGELDLAGTDFQLRVWRRLLEIPFGGQVTYGSIAADLGQRGDARAVGTAVAANPIAILIPCHRVVGAGGALRGYAWGLDLKGRLLAHELRIG